MTPPPATAATLKTQAQRLLGERAWVEALETLDAAAALGAEDQTLHTMTLRAAVNAGLNERALQAADRVLAFDPDNTSVLRLAALTLQRLSRDAEARAMHARARAVADAAAPPTLAALLTPGAAADGPVLPDRDGWSSLERFRWGAKAQAATRSLVAIGPDRHLSALLDLVETLPWAELANLLNGSGVVLVDSHLGLPHVTIETLARSGLRVGIVASNEEARLRWDPEMVFAVEETGSHTALIPLLRFVRSGGILFMAGDGGAGAAGRDETLDGVPVRFAPGPAVLAFLAKIPIYWSASLWGRDGILAQREVGPDPTLYADVDAFLAAWLDVYRARYLAAMRTGPENLFKAPPAGFGPPR